MEPLEIDRVNKRQKSQKRNLKKIQKSQGQTLK